MSVNSGFDDMQRDVDAEIDAVREARRRRDVFRTALPTAEDVLEVVPTGSLARGTHKEPIHDVDVVVVYDPTSHPTWGEPGDSALEALGHTRDLVNEKLGSDGTEGEGIRLTRLQNHAVKCFLDDPEAEGAFTVDVTPALRHPERGSGFPSGTEAAGFVPIPSTSTTSSPGVTPSGTSSRGWSASSSGGTPTTKPT
jgi:hypothetical protein